MSNAKARGFAAAAGTNVTNGNPALSGSGPAPVSSSGSASEIPPATASTETSTAVAVSTGDQNAYVLVDMPVEGNHCDQQPSTPPSNFRWLTKFLAGSSGSIILPVTTRPSRPTHPPPLLPPIDTRRSGSSREGVPPATATATTDEGVPNVEIGIIAAGFAVVLSLTPNIKDLFSSWTTTTPKVMYGSVMMLSVVSTVTSIFTASSPADSWARWFSFWCARLGLILAAAVWVVFVACQFGHSGCVAGAPAAVVVVVFMVVVCWKCSAHKAT